MLPEIVDAVIGPVGPVGPVEPSSASPPLGWHASRVAGQRLDPSLTLHESGVADGELIVLSTTEPPTPQRVHGDGCAAVLAAADRSTTGWGRAGPWVGLTGCLAAAVTLAWSGAQTPTPGPLWVAVLLALSSAAAAPAVRRAASAATTLAGLAAVAFAAAAGFLAVPHAPAPATMLLTASAALVTSTSMVRSACRDSVALGAVVTAAAGVVAVAAVCTMISPRIAVAGSLLAIPFWAGTLTAPSLELSLAFLFGEYLFAECWFGPTIAALQRAAPPAAQGTAQGLFNTLTLVGNLAPAVIGYGLKESSYELPSLLIVAVPVLYAASAAAFYFAADATARAKADAA